MLVPKAEPDNKTGCCRVDAYCTSSCVSRAPPMDGNTADSLTALCELRSTQRVSDGRGRRRGKILLLCRRQKCPRAQLPFQLRKPLTASVSLFVSERQSSGTWCCSLQPRVDTRSTVSRRQHWQTAVLPDRLKWHDPVRSRSYCRWPCRY